VVAGPRNSSTPTHAHIGSDPVELHVAETPPSTIVRDDLEIFFAGTTRASRIRKWRHALTTDQAAASMRYLRAFAPPAQRPVPYGMSPPDGV